MAKTVQAAEDRICSNGASVKQDIKSIFGFNLCSKTSQPPVRATPMSHSSYWTDADLAETVEQVNCNKLCRQFYYIPCTGCSTRVSSQIRTLQICRTSYWFSICFIFPKKWIFQVPEIWPSGSFKKTHFLYTFSPIEDGAIATVQNFYILVSEAPVDAEIIVLWGGYSRAHVITA